MQWKYSVVSVLVLAGTARAFADDAEKDRPDPAAVGDFVLEMGPQVGHGSWDLADPYGSYTDLVFHARAEFPLLGLLFTPGEGHTRVTDLWGLNLGFGGSSTEAVAAHIDVTYEVSAGLRLIYELSRSTEVIVGTRAVFRGDVARIDANNAGGTLFDVQPSLGVRHGKLYVEAGPSIGATGNGFFARAYKHVNETGNYYRDLGVRIDYEKGSEDNNATGYTDIVVHLFAGFH